MAMNSVTLMGRLTANPELKTTSSGFNYCRFSVAVDRYSKGEDKKTDFINCVAWAKTAEFIDRYFTKGEMIAVQGSIQTGSYTNKDGVKVYTTDINVEKAHFCGGKSDSGNVQTPQHTQTDTAQRNYSSGTAADFEQAPPDDDLPF